MTSKSKNTRKKIGRPKLPKGHAKGKIVPVRLNDSELKHSARLAKGQNQTLSDLIREHLMLWDDRLDEHGIDAIVWQGATQGDDHRKVLAIIFKELENGERFTVDLELITNAEHNHYSTPTMPDELEQRGIENAWVTTSKQPYVRSYVHIKFADLKEPVRIIKKY